MFKLEQVDSFRCLPLSPRPDISVAFADNLRRAGDITAAGCEAHGQVAAEAIGVTGGNGEAPLADAAQGVVVEDGIAAGFPHVGSDHAAGAVDGEVQDDTAVQMTLQLVPGLGIVAGGGQRDQFGGGLGAGQFADGRPGWCVAAMHHDADRTMSMG